MTRNATDYAPLGKHHRYRVITYGVPEWAVRRANADMIRAEVLLARGRARIVRVPACIGGSYYREDKSSEGYHWYARQLV